MLFSSFNLGFFLCQEGIVILPNVGEDTNEDDNHQCGAKEVKHVHAHITCASFPPLILKISYTEFPFAVIRDKLAAITHHWHHLHWLSIRSHIHHHLTIALHWHRWSAPSRSHWRHCHDIRRWRPPLILIRTHSPRRPSSLVHWHELLLLIRYLLDTGLTWVHLIDGDVIRPIQLLRADIRGSVFVVYTGIHLRYYSKVLLRHLSKFNCK